MTSKESSSGQPNFERVREAALRALGEVVPAGSPVTGDEPPALMSSFRTRGGGELPPYYLVYFLLFDLLSFPRLGPWQKTAWMVPVRYRGRLYAIEHRKMGLGIFAPSSGSGANKICYPTKEQEADAEKIACLIDKAVSVATPYFQWRAERAASGSQLNVYNMSASLFDRYQFFRDRYLALEKEAEVRKGECQVSKVIQEDGTETVSYRDPSSSLGNEAKWNAQAGIEAFFAWSEHAFIHLCILQGRLRTGDEVTKLAKNSWKEKFKKAFDLSDNMTKEHNDTLVDIREQLRNFMAHGAFGKRGEAFCFHSDAGAVPVLLSNSQSHRYSLAGSPAFNESRAIIEIEAFLSHLWASSLAPAKYYLFSGLPSILTYSKDGTYRQAMQSVESMKEFVDILTMQFDNAVNMDW